MQSDALSRWLRVYEKKRGNRRTGSGQLGAAGELIFFGVFLLLGCVGLVILFTALVIPEWRANYEFLEAACTVLGGRIGEKPDGEGGALYRPEIQIEYRIDGKRYVATTYDVSGGYSSQRQDKEAILAGFVAGRQYPCWYDPADPGVAVLVRGYRWWTWLFFLIPLSFILIGGGGAAYSLLHWSTSAERRASLTRRAQQLEMFDPHSRLRAQYPGIPAGADMTNSPGTTLAFRLPVGASAAWILFGLLLACLFWNGIVAVFLVDVLRALFASNPNWVMTAFLVPFVVVGAALVVIFFRQLLITTGIGPTLVEISDHPLRPAGRYDVFLSQTGRLNVNVLELLLVCDEKATYREGTDTRTESRRVFQQTVFRRTGFSIDRGTPFETRCAVEAPPGAMHSFKSSHNEVAWKLVVRGEVARWPDFERCFPVIVYPRGAPRTDA